MPGYTTTPQGNWRKPTRSLCNGECVEIASLLDKIAVRDSKNADGAVLLYSGKAWRSFMKSIKIDQGRPPL